MSASALAREYDALPGMARPVEQKRAEVTVGPIPGTNASTAVMQASHSVTAPTKMHQSGAIRLSLAIISLAYDRGVHWI